MNIIIKTDEKDAKDLALVDGFAAGTNWNDRSPLTKTEWLAKKAGEWVAQQARQGRTVAAVIPDRATYVTSVRAAAGEAKTAISDPGVTLEAAAVVRVG